MIGLGGGLVMLMYVKAIGLGESGRRLILLWACGEKVVIIQWYGEREAGELL